MAAGKNNRYDGKSIKGLMSGADYLDTRDLSIFSLWAETGLGKSRFILTAPPPVYFLSFEPDGPLHAIKAAIDEGIIESSDLFVDEIIKNALGDDAPLIRTLEEEELIYEYAKERMSWILQNGEQGGTIGIDTGTTFSQCLTEVEMEDIIAKRDRQGKSLYPFDYQYANKAMKGVIERLRAGGFNVIITHHANPSYNAKGQKLKNKWEYQGNNSLPKWVDVQFRLQGKLVEVEESGEKIERFQRWATLEKVRQDMELVGEEVDDPTFDSILDGIDEMSRKRKVDRKALR